jgi:xylan 1,4-beta-xylosidase
MLKKRRFFIYLLLCLLYFNVSTSNSSPADIDINLLDNGDFSHGTRSWNLYTQFGGEARFSTVNQELHVQITDGGDHNWSVVVNQIGLHIIPRHLYAVSFNARCEYGTRNLSVKVGMAVDPWTLYSEYESFTIDSEKKQYSFQFTMHEHKDTNAHLEFQLGTSDIDVYLDDIKMVGRLFDPQGSLIKVDCREALGNIRSLQGVNDGPVPWNQAYDFSAYYRDMGVNWVRLHDLHGPIGDWDGEWVGAVDIHRVFPDFNADADNPENYDFARTDMHIQSIRDMGADIIYRLGYSWETVNDPPADFSQWAAICLHIIKHYNDGWAGGFHYNITYWEIWNEPDLEVFWNGTPQQFFELYNVTARTIKDYNPALKVGGPALALVNDYNFLEDFLSYCRNHSVPLDFVSWHVYSKNPYDVYRKAEAVENAMKTYGFASSQSLLTEWNMWAEASEWDDLRRDPALAAFTSSALIYLQDSTVDIANYYRGDSWPWGGLFTSQGNPGKGFYAFKAFHMLLQTPGRVFSSGGDNNGYAVMAGISRNGRSVTILVSSYDSGFSQYELNVYNLPWGNAPFTYNRYVLDQNRNLELVDDRLIIPKLAQEKSTDQEADFSIINQMPSPSVQLIKLTKKHPGD